MSRLMSVAFTEQAVVERRKTVTRRKGWWTDKNGRRLIYPGDHLTLCRKVMGRKPGEPLVRICEVEVIDVRREPLCAVGGPYVIDRNGATIWPEMIAEGFPDMSPTEFMLRYFIDAQGIGVMDDVTRIQWRYLDETPLAQTFEIGPKNARIAGTTQDVKRPQQSVFAHRPGPDHDDLTRPGAS